MSPRRLFALVAAALLAPAASRAGDCRPEFIHGDRYEIGNGTTGLFTADVNDDGYPDLTVTSNFPREATVRLGNPDGTFGDAIETETGRYLYEAILANFTTDDLPDLVTMGDQDFVLMRGNGDGTFQAGVELGERLGNLSAGDVNNDGKLDILGHSLLQPVFIVLLGNGDGTFQPPIETPLKVSAGSYALGDVVGDDNPDLVSTIQDGESVVIAPGSGDGHFGLVRFVPVGVALTDLILADLEGDGDLDLAVGTGSYVAVLLNDGSGNFGVARNYPTGRTVLDLDSGDVDGDGHPDVVAFSSGFPSASEVSSFVVLRGAGDGTLEPDRTFLLDLLYSGVAVADFGNDGSADVAAAALFTGKLDVHLGFGDGGFRALPLTIINDFSSGSVPGDFNEDGRTDVALTVGQNLVAYLAVGGGWYAASVPQPASSAFEAAAADFNLDGHLDYVSATGSAIRLLAGNGDGTFQPATALPVQDGTAELIVTGDFDVDEKPDFAVYNHGIFGSGIGIEVYFGRGDGTFEDPVPVQAGDQGTDLAAADFNGDGRDDLALTRSTGQTATLEVFLAAPGRTFLPPAVRDIPGGPQSLTAGDFRHNDRPDIAVCFFSQEVRFFTNQGDGSFDAGTPIAGSPSGTQLVAADFDGGGDLDLGLNRVSSVLIFPGDGNGSFGTPAEYALPNARPIHPLDADGNGTIDIVAVSDDYPNSALSTLLNGELGAVVASGSAVVGTAATLEAHAGGFGVLTYQWRKDGVGLSDGGSISGTTTPTLTIDPVSFDDAGSYDVVVTDACGEVTSNPATLSVEFADVPLSSPFHDDILTIATQGITGGCGGGNYCPTSPVRRDQMAVFLLKSEHGSDYAPPACTGVFDDVPCPGSFTDWVEQLAAEGVTGGCGVDVYCPSQAVTRAQMAVFLLKTKEGSGYTPPPATGIFGDVPVGSFAADFIEDLYDRAITGGCSVSPLLYCPSSAVLRQQMATFLVRTFLP